MSERFALGRSADRTGFSGIAISFFPRVSECFALGRSADGTGFRGIAIGSGEVVRSNLSCSFTFIADRVASIIVCMLAFVRIYHNDRYNDSCRKNNYRDCNDNDQCYSFHMGFLSYI